MEKYKEAISDYLTAHQIDPTLNAKVNADNIKAFVVKTAGLINKKVNDYILMDLGRIEADKDFRNNQDHPSNIYSF